MEEFIGSQKKLNEIFENYLRERNQTREEILIAFIAKFGCEPHEIVQIQQNTANGVKFWVEKRSEIDRVKIPDELEIEREARIEAQNKVNDLLFELEKSNKKLNEANSEITKAWNECTRIYRELLKLQNALIFDEEDWSYNVKNLPNEIHQKIKDDRDKIIFENKQEALKRENKGL